VESEPQLDDPLPLTNDNLEENENDAMQLPDVEAVPPVAQPKHFRLMSWLCGINNDKPLRNDNIHVEYKSIVSCRLPFQLIFSHI